MNERGDSKVESNDSPEIPDRGETLDIPGLPSGFEREREKERDANINTSYYFTSRGSNDSTTMTSYHILSPNKNLVACISSNKLP